MNGEERGGERGGRGYAREEREEKDIGNRRERGERHCLNMSD